MSLENSSRRYKGSYYNRKNEKKFFGLKIENVKRFAAMTGLITLTTIGSCMIMVGPAIDDIKESVFPRDKIVIDQTPSITLERNKEEIEQIISTKPNILKDISLVSYEVELGDSMSYLAEMTGNTVKRLNILNNMSSDDLLVAGSTIKLEVLEDKQGLDKEIACLESYFEDYLLRSATAKEFRNQFFGTGNDETIDAKSVEGMYINLSMNFHDKLKTQGSNITEEDKHYYIESLMALEHNTANLINRNNKEVMTPYEKYKIYLENGTTKYDEVQDHIHSIYG